MAREVVKDFYGRIIGSIEKLADGSKILGRYDKKQGVTKDFYGRIIGTGDATSKLVWDSVKDK